MITVLLLCKMLLVTLILPKDTLAEIKLARNKYKQQIQFVSLNLSEFILNIKVKYPMVKHILYLVPLSEKNDLVNQVMDLLLKILHKISYVMTIVDRHSCSYLQEEMISYDQVPTQYHYPGLYIIPFLPQQTVQCFNDQLELLARSLEFNPKAIFIITVFQGSQAYSQNALLFDILWSKNLFATILLVITDWQIGAFWAKPFSSSNKCKQIEQGGITFKLVMDLTHNSIDAYEDKLISDYKGCVFSVGTIPMPPYVIGTRVVSNGQTHYDFKYGIEIELLKLLSSKINVTIEFSKTLSYDSNAIYSTLPNGSVVGTLKDVIDHKIDATFGGIAPSYLGYYKFDYVFSHKASIISLFLANAGPIPQWKILLIVFDRQVWMVSIFLFIIVVIIYCGLGRLLRQFYQGQTMNASFVFIEMLPINIGFPTNLRPNSWSMRLLFFAWAIYSVHWGLAYTTLLVALQTNAPRDKDITTLTELLQSGLQVRVDQLHRALFANIQMDSVSTLLLNRSAKCEPAACLPDLLTHRNFSLVAKVEMMDYAVDTHLQGIHSLSESLLTFSVAFVLNKGNPLSGELALLCLRALQAGLTGRWEIEAKRTSQRDQAAGLERVTTHTLSLSDLRGAFIVLSYGLAAALCVLIIEIVLNWYFKWSRGIRSV